MGAATLEQAKPLPDKHDQGECIATGNPQHKFTSAWNGFVDPQTPKKSWGVGRYAVPRPRLHAINAEGTRWLVHATQLSTAEINHALGV